MFASSLYLENPSDISGCLVWLRADNGITKDESNNVSAWADQSGNGNDFFTNASDIRPDGSEFPVWVNSVLNGKPGVRFTFDDPLHAAFISSLTEASIFIVLVPTDTMLDGTMFFCLSNDAGQWNFGVLARIPVSNLVYSYGAGDDYVNGGAVQVGVPLSAILTTKNNDYVEVWESGISKGTQTVGTLWTSYTDIALSGRAAIDRFASCDVLELAFYSRKLLSEDISKLVAYSLDRYGV
jgi:hypothetical protein